MSAQDKTEKTLRDIHVLLSQSEVYNKEDGLVIVKKKDMIGLLGTLNQCILEMMEEYELTKQGRDRVERETRKAGEEIVADANQKAEDVYAASVLYTEEALHHVQDIMQEAAESVKALYEKMEEDLQKERMIVREDQSELKSHLQDLKDTDKYLNIIEDRNRKIAKEKEKEKESEPSPFTAVKPEIRVNEDYLREHGLIQEEGEEQLEEKPEPATAEVSVNLDSEYFKWKENDGEMPDAKTSASDKKTDVKSFLGKFLNQK